MATQAHWKPNREEAQFIGELLNVNVGLAEMARDMLAKGQSLTSVVDAFKAATEVAGLLRGAAR